MLSPSISISPLLCGDRGRRPVHVALKGRDIACECPAGEVVRGVSEGGQTQKVFQTVVNVSAKALEGRQSLPVFSVFQSGIGVPDARSFA
jgi:hypothetical protein